jgi:hypothetical protein
VGFQSILVFRIRGDISIVIPLIFGDFPFFFKIRSGRVDSAEDG